MSECINIRNTKLNLIEDSFNISNIVQEIESTNYEDAFYILDIEDLKRKYDTMIEKLPRVTPYYAVKCNREDIVLRTLASLGVRFDCASNSEIDMILALGVPCEEIIFANPMKSILQLQHARAKNVNILTFDSSCELYKIKSHHPAAKLVIRIRCDSLESIMMLGKKFGCDADNEAPKLLDLAKSLQLNVVGVCFHVGTGCKEYQAYERAISMSKKVFEYASEIGFKMHILDIGGGFPGDKDEYIDQMAEVINKALQEHFPSDSVQIISEPGRYFVGSAFTVLCKVFEKKMVPSHDSADNLKRMIYFTNTSLYNAFFGHYLDKIPYAPVILGDHSGELFESTLYGTTTCHRDQICIYEKLPELNIGDWIMFPNMGAYTTEYGVPFNGFPVPAIFPYVNKNIWSSMYKNSKYLQ